MTTDLKTAQLHRARELSLDMARDYFALLSSVPDSSPALRGRITRATGVVIVPEDVFGPERVRLAAPFALPGATSDLLRRITTHATSALGGTLANVIEAGEKERAWRLGRASALRVGTLRRLLDANRLRRATVDHMVSALALFETLPVRPGADFDATLDDVARGSGFAAVSGGYRLVDETGNALGRVVTDENLGVGRSREELEGAAAEAADEYAAVLELILALLWASSGTDGVDALLTEGESLIDVAGAGELDDIGLAPTGDLDLEDPDARLRLRFRRAVHLHGQMLPLREAARRITGAAQAEEDAAARRSRIIAEFEAKKQAKREANRRAAAAEVREMRLGRYDALTDDAQPTKDGLVDGDYQLG
jgi:hypothetical protein